MYFDRRLWLLTAGHRLATASGVGLGLLSLAAGIARFAFLGLSCWAHGAWPIAR